MPVQSLWWKARTRACFPSNQQFSAENDGKTFILSIGAVIAATFALAPSALAGIAFQEAAKAGSAVNIASKATENRLLIEDLRVVQLAIAPILIQSQSDFAVAGMVGEPGRPISVDITMPAFNATDYLLLSFRRLPKDFSLSSGFRTAEAWLVSAHEAKNLWLIPPKDFNGEFDLEVQLIRGQNVEPVVQTVRVKVQPQNVAGRKEPQTQATSGTIPEVLPSDIKQEQVQSLATETNIAGRQEPINQEKEEELLTLARSMLQQNDISAARLVYARLARQGSVRGALTLAQTYDSAFLSHYDVTGLQPDMEKAKYWYGVAASLGSEDASGRLLALEGAGQR